MNVFDESKKAKALIDTSPMEAIEIYESIWEAAPNEFDAWLCFFYLKALRKKLDYNSSIIDVVVDKHKTDERVRNIYGWWVFEKYVKKANRNELLKNDGIVLKMAGIVTQKDLSQKQEFPCPWTIALFSLIDAHAENLYNAKKIEEILSLIKPEFLSPVADTNGQKEYASDFEEYYSNLTKALLKLGKYEKCIETCNAALSKISNFHYNNDLWFKMRIAISLNKLGQKNESEKLFQELLSTKAGYDKSFLYEDLAELYYEIGEIDKAWSYSISAAYYGSEPKFLLSLYLMQARILFKKNRPEDAKILAELIAATHKEEDSSLKPEQEKLITYFKIDMSSLQPTSKYFEAAKALWNKERYKDSARIQGVISFIHPKGKKGDIKADKNSVHFSKKDLRNKVRDLNDLKDSIVEFYLMDSFDGSKVAEDITIVQKGTPQKTNFTQTAPIGQVVTGTVKVVKDFGIIMTLPGMRDGLLHIKNMVSPMKENFMETYKRGDEITIVILKETEKGIELKQNV